jgi:hypothetical protein
MRRIDIVIMKKKLHRKLRNRWKRKNKNLQNLKKNHNLLLSLQKKQSNLSHRRQPLGIY